MHRKKVTIHYSGVVTILLEDGEITDDGVYEAWVNQVSDNQVAREARMGRWWEPDPGAPQPVPDGRGRRRPPYSDAEVRTSQR